MLYDGAEHISLATLEGMRERTITINALSKTYSVTGWRVGWAIAPAEITSAHPQGSRLSSPWAPRRRCRKRVPWLCSFRPAITTALARDYTVRRERLLGILTSAGFRCFKPRGAYYIMTDISAFGFPDDVAFAKYLVTEIGVAAVPARVSITIPPTAKTYLRFTFCKTEKTFPGRRRASCASPPGRGRAIMISNADERIRPQRINRSAGNCLLERTA